MPEHFKILVNQSMFLMILMSSRKHCEEWIPPCLIVGAKSLPIFKQYPTHPHKNVCFKHILQRTHIMLVSNVKYVLRDFSKKKIQLLKDSNKDRARNRITKLWNQWILTDLKTRDLCNERHNQSLPLNSHQKNADISL